MEQQQPGLIDAGQPAVSPQTHYLITEPITSDDRSPALVYITGLGLGSRRTMLQVLNTIARLVTGGVCNARSLDWSALRYEHTQAIRTALTERYAPATASKAIAALRGVLREAWRLGLIDAETYHRAVDLKPIRGETLPRGRALSARELASLFEACVADKTPAGARDAAILAVLYGAGLRRSEVVTLDLNDYSPDDGALTIRCGKGRKDRLAYATNGIAQALTAWLRVRGCEPGPLFCPINRGGRVLRHRMTSQAVYNMLRKRGAEAGVKMLSPHDLRRTFVSDLLDSGADVVAVQHLAGHLSVTTTARYDRRGEAAKKKAAELLAVPYKESTRL